MYRYSNHIRLAALLLCATSAAQELNGPGFGPSTQTNPPAKIDGGRLQSWPRVETPPPLLPYPGPIAPTYYPVPDDSATDWRLRHTMTDRSSVETVIADGPALLTFPESGVNEVLYDHAVVGEATLSQWNGETFAPLPEGEPLAANEDWPIAVIPAGTAPVELILARRWDVPAGYEVDPSDRLLLPEADGVLPLFIHGDVNEDGAVDRQDLELLNEWLSNHTSMLTCLAAGDLTNDGNVTVDDAETLAAWVDAGVDFPALSFSPNLPCRHANLMVAVVPEEPTGDLRLRPIGEATLDVRPLDPGAAVKRGDDGRDLIIEAPLAAAVTSILVTTNGRDAFYTFSSARPVAPSTPPPLVFGEKGNDDGGFNRNLDDVYLISNDCPQRGKGCIGLILDFIINNEAVHVNSRSDRKLSNAKDCDITYHAPQFKRYPEPLLVGLGNGKRHMNGISQKAVDAVNAHNALTWLAVNRALKQYAAKAPGNEHTMEVVFAHGSTSRNGWVFGFKTGFDNTVQALLRSTFHTTIYNATRRKICSHLVLDATCYSGNTPTIVQQLNNSGQASGGGTAAPVNHGQHAAWELDAAFGTAPRDNTCTGTIVNRAKQALNAAFAKNGKDVSKTFESFIATGPRRTSYVDRGYQTQGGRALCTTHGQWL